MEELAKLSNVKITAILKKHKINIPSEVDRFQLLATVRQLLRDGTLKLSDFKDKEE